MYQDLSGAERRAFVSQTDGCFIPGYTGHCPTLKFRFGKRYGANTKEALQEFEQQAGARREAYRLHDPQGALLTPVRRSQGQQEDPGQPVRQRGRPYVLGYTGFIPGLHFRYGKSFRRAADDSVMEFNRRAEEEEHRRRNQRSRSAPKTPSIRSRDEVKRALEQFQQQRRYPEEHRISPEFPPIAGYTGHIPRLRVTEASLSQRFSTAARLGLALMRREREQRAGACGGEAPGVRAPLLQAVPPV
ncbi:ciliary microtubule inner protein 2B-like [Bacillus rossius redtenbacheri]|uniref:ciliary microtubule inner protein 2B-like n=1 Tax=Bacillus rossius redtenbacheri TaxID=93214 RepID=UPI002FDE36A1